MTSLIEVREVRKYFEFRANIFSREKGSARAVDGVSFDIREDETFGLAGESGCGKTTLGRLLLKMLEPDGGLIRFAGKDIVNLSRDELKRFRSKAQIVFQNPFASLNPRKSIRQILSRPLLLHGICQKDEVESRVMELLSSVGLTPSETFMDRYPHEFSGGQTQRIGIARAIAVRPKFIVGDEPVSSLDVSTRGQILNLMKKLQRELGITYLFITHDLAVLRSVAKVVAIMYLGKIVEIGGTDEIFYHFKHPYTQAIIQATPIPDPEITRKRERIILRGQVPSNMSPPRGCKFHTRCPYARVKCSKIEPELLEYKAGSSVACHFPLS